MFKRFGVMTQQAMGANSPPLAHPDHQAAQKAFGLIVVCLAMARPRRSSAALAVRRH